MRAVKDHLATPSNNGEEKIKGRERWPGDSLCSRNARPQKALVGCAHVGGTPSPSSNGPCSVEERTMETTWSPHERIANKRDGNFLLTGLGAIRNRACVLMFPSAEIPVD